MVTLSASEKKKLCNTLSCFLPRIRELLGVTQAEMGELCGFSRARVSQIESGHSPMRWGQWMAIMYLCSVNRRTKDFMFANDLSGTRIFQYLQRLDENIPPDIDLPSDYQRMSELQAELSRTRVKTGFAARAAERA